MKYEQSRDTGNIGNKTQNKDIQNNNKTTQYGKLRLKQRMYTID